MASISYDKLVRSKFYSNIPAKHRVQEINLNHLKLKVNDTYETGRKKNNENEPSNDLINEAYPVTKLSKAEDHITYMEKEYTDYKLRDDKQSEDVLIERAVETTIRVLYDKGFFDKYDNADEALKNYLPIDEVNERRRPYLEELNDVIR